MSIPALVSHSVLALAADSPNEKAQLQKLAFGRESDKAKPQSVRTLLMLSQTVELRMAAKDGVACGG